MEKYDVAVIGSGPGGYVAALRAGLAGLRVVLVEKNRIGGTCLNRGCIPTKALIASALTTYRAGHGSSVGQQDFPVTFSDKGAFDHASRTVQNLAKGVETLFRKRNVSLIKGRGVVSEPGRVDIHTDDSSVEVQAANLVIATGSAPFFPKGLEPDGGVVLGSDEILELGRPVGKTVVVIGGGIIGTELACYYAMTGRRVTIVELLDRILPMAPPSVSKEMTRALKRMRIGIKTGCKVAGIGRNESGAAVSLADGSVLEAETVISAVGRRPCLDGMDVDGLGLARLDNGRVAVDKCGNAADGVYVIGDAAGSLPMLAHVASHQAVSAVRRITGEPDDDGLQPAASVVYTHPEAAWVGRVPGGPDDGGNGVGEASFPLRALGRAHTVGETAGYVTLYHDDNSTVVGGEIVGEGAGENIAAVALAVRMGAALEDLAGIPFPHPTFSEALLEAAMVGLGLPLHTV
ncbi:MAG: FAD-dependent oxidoreductase [Planctomycetes bacterium]|nr:FAD-dependent oxidoreductase [Planctomycetota bacterium]